MIKAILFDFDGTLANTTDVILAGFHKACIDILGHDVTDAAIIRTFGLTLKAGMEILADKPEQVDPMRAVYREFFYTNHDAMIKLLPGVYDTLAELHRRGIAMAVVTSKRKPMAIHGTEYVGLSPFISCIVSCDDTANPKPAPDGMLLAAEKLGVRPEDCLCVGDTPFDIISGHRAGALGAAVRYTLFDWEEMLEQGKPDFILEEFKDLLDIVDRKPQ